jgi:hypothetical protein
MIIRVPGHPRHESLARHNHQGADSEDRGWPGSQNLTGESRSQSPGRDTVTISLASHCHNLPDGIRSQSHWRVTVTISRTGYGHNLPGESRSQSEDRGAAQKSWHSLRLAGQSGKNDSESPGRDTVTVTTRAAI